MPPKKTPKRKASGEGNGAPSPKRAKPSPPSPTTSVSSAGSTASPDPFVDQNTENKRLNAHLTRRAGDLGIPIDPTEGADDEAHPSYDSDDSDVPMVEPVDPITNLRERCDNLVDDIEEALRTVDNIAGHTMYSEIIIPKKPSRKTRNQRRRRHGKTYKLDTEVGPICILRESKEKGKKKKKVTAPMTALALRNLAKTLSQQLVEELKKRGVQNPHDIARFKYLSKRAQEADAAEGRKPAKQMLEKVVDEVTKGGFKYPGKQKQFRFLTKKVKEEELEEIRRVKARERALDQQWNNHGLSLRQLLNLLKSQGSRCVNPTRKELEEKCRKYGLSTQGELWDLDRSILMYEIARGRRLPGLPGEARAALDSIISLLGEVEVPESETVETAAGTGDGEKDDDDAGGPFENLALRAKDKGKGKETGTGTGTDGKGAKKGGTGKGAKGKPAAPRNTRATRGNNARRVFNAEELEMAEQRRLTMTTGGQTQTFGQTNVSGAGNRCFWHAVQRLWLGRERDVTSGPLSEQYPVHARVEELWDAVMRPPENVTNPARQTRLALYQTLQNDSRQNTHGSLETRIRNLEMGDEDMAQLVADALDVEIFMYRPIWSDAGRVTDWYRIVRGQPQTEDRQLHLANYSEALHWTALTVVGNFVLPPLGPENRQPSFTQPPNTPPINRLRAGDTGNQDLRPASRRESPENGHVADLSEEMITEEDAEDEDEDGTDSKDGGGGGGGGGGG
ncbi:hypothetical protein D6C89_09243, partial [Aureobasidium pullulans]